VDADGFVKQLGQAIRDYRKAANLTQEALAEKLESSAEWVSQVERGVGCPSIAMLLGIADAVGASPAAIMETAWAGSDSPELARELQRAAARLPDSSVRVLLAAAQALEAELVGSRD